MVFLGLASCQDEGDCEGKEGRGFDALGRGHASRHRSGVLESAGQAHVTFLMKVWCGNPVALSKRIQALNIRTRGHFG